VAVEAVELDICCLVCSLCVVRSCPLTAFSLFVHHIHKPLRVSERGYEPRNHTAAGGGQSARGWAVSARRMSGGVFR